MVKSIIGQLVFFLLIFPLLLSFNPGSGHLKFANGQTWCVARPSASEGELDANIEYACNELNDCKVIQPGGSCFNPNNLINHASVVMNQYYALKGRNTWNCYFLGTGLIVLNDPSYSGCNYA